jgi:hypothetical protein
MNYSFKMQTETGATISSPGERADEHPSSQRAGVCQFPSSTTTSRGDCGLVGAEWWGSSGQWQRGVPVNDPNWLYARPTDAGWRRASATITQNIIRDNSRMFRMDRVRLTSPSLNLAAVGAGMRSSCYAILLHLTTPGRRRSNGSWENPQ